MNTPEEQTTFVPADDASTVITPAPPAELIQAIGDHCRGEVLDGRWTVREVRGGRGVSGMGIVYIVEDENDGALYAMKTFQREYARNLTFIERFIREAQTWMLTGFHPNIVHPYLLDIIDAVPYLIMEFVPSDEQGRHSIADYLGRGALSMPLALDFAIQTCAGFDHATRAVPGLVHRDLKPENVLVTPEGVAKVTDFGLVRCRVHGELLRRVADVVDLSDSETQRDLTRAGAVFGTPAYMSPEQFEDPTAVTTASDIYALGCCLYEMLTGSTPFVVHKKATLERIAEYKRRHREERVPPLRERMRQCPRELDLVVLRCLAKDPAKRFATFAELGDEIIRIQHKHLGIDTRPIPEAQPTARQVAMQGRSISLLEGYAQAVRLRHLRERQESSPYSFHIALASYFHCNDDTLEEERQLHKAQRVRHGERGDEAARRLAELLIRNDDVTTAEAVLQQHLQEHPDATDAVLEPLFALHLLHGRFGEAAKLLESLSDDVRSRPLCAAFLRAQRETAQLRDYLRAHKEGVLNRAAEAVARLQPDDVVGVEHPDDLDLLRHVLSQYRPRYNCAILDVVDTAVWPDLSGFPDFAQPLAWLSADFGELAEIEDDPAEAENLQQLAVELGYPARLPRLLERDERWFWLPVNGNGGG